MLWTYGLNFGMAPSRFLRVISLSMIMNDFPTGVGAKDASASKKNTNTMPTPVEFEIEAMTVGTIYERAV